MVLKMYKGNALYIDPIAAQAVNPNLYDEPYVLR